MKRISRPLLLCLILKIVSFPVLSQRKSDFSGWLTSDIVYSPKKWDFTGSLELRTKGRMKEIDLLSAAVYGRYRFFPLLKPSVGYELFECNTETGYSLEHRLLIQNESTIKTSFFQIDNRLSLLNDFKTIDNPYWGLRDRIRIKRRIKKFEPHISVELYYTLKNKSIRSYKNRYTAGIIYYFNDQNSVNLYYMNEYYLQKPFANNILGLYYCFYMK